METAPARRCAAAETRPFLAAPDVSMKGAGGGTPRNRWNENSTATPSAIPTIQRNIAMVSRARPAWTQRDGFSMAVNKKKGDSIRHETVPASRPGGIIRRYLRSRRRDKPLVRVGCPGPGAGWAKSSCESCERSATIVGRPSPFLLGVRWPEWDGAAEVAQAYSGLRVPDSASRAFMRPGGQQGSPASIPPSASANREDRAKVDGLR